MPTPTLTEALAAGIGSSHIYATFTVEGATFYLSDMHFVEPGGFPTSAVVSDWGSFRKYMAMDGRERTSELEIEFIANATLLSTTGTVPMTFIEFLQRYQLRDVAVTFYQWNDLAGASTAVWTGYWQQISGYSVRGGIAVCSIRFGESESAFSAPMSSIVNPADFSGAPIEAIGDMVPIAYGTRLTKHSSSFPALGSSASVLFGFGSRFVRGVITDQNQSLLQRQVRFTQNGGTLPSKDVVNSFSSDTPATRSDLYIWIPDASAAAQVDQASWTLLNTGYTGALADAEPIVYIPVKLGDKGSMGHSGFNTTLYKLQDDDPTNYLQTTGTDYRIAMNIQTLQLRGIRIGYLCFAIEYYGAHASGTRDFEFGCWNDFNTAAAGWLGNASKRKTVTGVAVGAGGIVYCEQYLAGDFGHNVAGGSSTQAEFSDGRFIGRDANNAETPLQFFFQTTSASKDGIRLVNVAAFAKVKLALDRTTSLRRTRNKPPRLKDPKGRIVDPQGRYTGRKYTPEIDTVIEALDAVPVEFVLTGTLQKDDGGGTYSGTANGNIRNGAAIAHHVIVALGGASINSSSGTLGNFTDAKTEDTAGEKNVDADFGPDMTTIGDALTQLQARHPIRIHKEDGVYQCVYDEMNPHSSRFYRSTSSIRRISAERDLISLSNVADVSLSQIRNSVRLNYGHAYGTNKPLGTTTYDNPLSQDLFGVRPYEDLFDEPWITCEDLTPGTVNPAAEFLAKHRGRVYGRPRLSLVCALAQEFFDLKRGHVVEFDTDMEDLGFNCPAFRCGYFDYAFFRSDVLVANQAMDDTPTFLPSGSVTSETVFGSSQQYDEMRFNVTDGSTYTAVNNGWEYYNGAAWVAHSNVTATLNGAAIDPDDAFKAIGLVVVRFDRPSPWLWKKAELTFGSTAKGPCYWTHMKYSTAVDIAGGGAISTYPAKWYGRLFEVIEVTRKPGAEGDYPYVEAVLQEVM